MKRATRILPPLLLLLLATALLLPISPIVFAGYLISLGDVFAYAHPFRSLDSLWSLAVEEHFYIVWPFAVRYLPRRILLYLLGGTLFAEPLFRSVASALKPGWEATYYLTPFRLDGLCFGCLLAIGLESERIKHGLARWGLVGLGLSGIAWITLRGLLGKRFTRADPSLFYNALAYSIISFGAFSLIAYLVTNPDSIPAKWLSVKPLVFCGVISYGLYLYQLLVRELVVTSLHLSFRQAFYVDLPVTFLLAWASFAWYERPLIAWGRKQASSFQREGESALRVRSST